MELNPGSNIASGALHRSKQNLATLRKDRITLVRFQFPRRKRYGLLNNSSCALVSLTFYGGGQVSILHCTNRDCMIQSGYAELDIFRQSCQTLHVLRFNHSTVLTAEIEIVQSHHTRDEMPIRSLQLMFRHFNLTVLTWREYRPAIFLLVPHWKKSSLATTSTTQPAATTGYGSHGAAFLFPSLTDRQCWVIDVEVEGKIHLKANVLSQHCLTANTTPYAVPWFGGRFLLFFILHFFRKCLARSRHKFCQLRSSSTHINEKYGNCSAAPMHGLT